MSARISNLGLQECVNFYNIEDHQMGNHPTIDADVFVPKDTLLTLNISNDDTTPIGDLFVFGKLFIRSINLSRHTPKATLVARNVFVIGKLKCQHTILRSHNIFFIRDFAVFRKDVLEQMRSLMKDKKQ